MLRVLLSFCFICFFGICQAQEVNIIKKDDKREFIYKSAWSIGARLNTNGWTVFGEKVRILNLNRQRIIQMEIGRLKNFRAQRQAVNSNCNDNQRKREFVFGKRNDFFNLHLNYGYRSRIADKADKAGVRLSATYLVGASLGLLKPYQLNLINTDEPPNPGGCPSTIRTSYSDEVHDAFTNKALIDGYSGFRYGFNSIEPVPGLHAKTALHFDWANFDKMVKAIEAGVQADVFYKPIPILIDQKNSPLFMSMYLSMQIGKRK